MAAFSHRIAGPHLAKSVSVWHVEYALFSAGRWEPRVIPVRSREEAVVAAKNREDVQYYACVKITGPHSQEMPT